MQATRGGLPAAVPQRIFQLLPTSRRRVSVYVGLALVALSLFFGLRLYPRTGSAPTTPVGVGLAMSPPLQAGSLTYVTRLQVSVTTCSNPVSVTQTIAIPSEVWRRAFGAKGLGGTQGERRTSFDGIQMAFAEYGVPNVSPLQDYSVIPINSAYYASGLTAPELRTYRQHLYKADRSDPIIFDTTYVPRDHDNSPGISTFSGSIIGWPNSFGALVISYHVDWLAPRSYGTCYLTIPDLTSGGGTADDAARNAQAFLTSSGALAARPLAASYASVVLDLQDVETSPTPSDAASSTVIRNCASANVMEQTNNPTRKYRGVISRDGFFATKLRGYEGGTSQPSGCGGVVVLTERGADDRRSAIVFVLGATFALGLTLLAEALLREQHGVVGYPWPE